MSAGGCGTRVFAVVVIFGSGYEPLPPSVPPFLPAGALARSVGKRSTWLSLPILLGEEEVSRAVMTWAWAWLARVNDLILSGLVEDHVALPVLVENSLCLAGIGQPAGWVWRQTGRIIRGRLSLGGIISWGLYSDCQEWWAVTDGDCPPFSHFGSSTTSAGD